MTDEMRSSDRAHLAPGEDHLDDVLPHADARCVDILGVVKSAGPEVVPATGRPAGAAFAISAGIVGLCYTAMSIYWGVGGTALLDTVGGSLERAGRAGDAGVVLLLWAAIVLKLVAVILPLLVIYRRRDARWQWVLRGLAWAAGAVLFLYGLVLTVVGLLVQIGVIAASPTADHLALAWHAYLWDPWFLLWGILVLGALLTARTHNRMAAKPLNHHRGDPRTAAR